MKVLKTVPKILATGKRVVMYGAKKMKDKLPKFDDRSYTPSTKEKIKSYPWPPYEIAKRKSKRA